MPTSAGRSYLGVDAPRPRVGFFEFTSCEGCQLQLLNDEERLPAFLDLIEIVAFREIMSESEEVFDIAVVEGSISCEEEIPRLRDIRRITRTVVALGSCACFGGINQLRNRFAEPAWPMQRVYGGQRLPVTPLPEVLPLAAVIEVDVRIFGCPVHKQEVERIFCDLVLGKRFAVPKYPVCMECSARSIVCRYDLDDICLGPVTRGGCGAWCPAGGGTCHGCRGPAEAANIDQLLATVRHKKLGEDELFARMALFGGFRDWLSQLSITASGQPEDRKANENNR